ncbi:hypothetical protein N182_10735 [Sinorhizobium sp. GL2]|nr:hypothetical protein N182_10735 [Sinorhizobium sp. GL2]
MFVIADIAVAVVVASLALAIVRGGPLKRVYRESFAE